MCVCWGEGWKEKETEKNMEVFKYYTVIADNLKVNNRPRLVGNVFILARIYDRVCQKEDTLFSC